MFKTILSVLGISLLAACASKPTGLTMYQLETEPYLITSRNRLPIDFPHVQKNLFQHQATCQQQYQFKMAENESSFAYVIYQPENTLGLEDAVVLSMVLLHDRSINVKAYSYKPGNMDRVHQMLTAIMMPENCGIDSSWENTIGKEEE